jgi:hypothetical protein
VGEVLLGVGRLSRVLSRCGGFLGSVLFDLSAKGSMPLYSRQRRCTMCPSDVTALNFRYDLYLSLHCRGCTHNKRSGHS